MSRQIDPDNLNAEDLLYIAHRPQLRQEFILQGYDDPLEGFDFSVLNPNEEATYGKIAEPGEGSGDEEDSDWNKSMPKADLLAAIVARNEDREEDDLITVEGFEGNISEASVEDVKKDPLIAALKADDEASSQ